MSLLPSRRSLVVLGVAAVGATLVHTWLTPGEADNGPQTVCAGHGTTTGLVTRVTDGDTLRVALCGAQTVVRVIGMDTPETKRPGVRVQCYGPEATRYATGQLADREVRLVPDRRAGAKDRYGRSLYHVEVGGADYAEGAIRAGFARHHDYGRRQDRSQTYAQAQSQARRDRVGLWGACPNPFKE